jgi:hypothetical protein
MKTLTKKTGKLALALVLAISMLLSLASCTPEAPPPEPEKPISYFILQLENEDVLVDENGAEIMRAEFIDYIPEATWLNDVTMSYVAVSRWVSCECIEEDDIITTALYSTDGTMLQDFKEVTYAPAFGEYIICASDDFIFYAIEYMDVEGEGAFSNIINVNTGEVLFENILKVVELDENTFVLYGFNSGAIYVVDVEGNILHTFPEGSNYQYFEKYGEYYVVVAAEPVEFNFDYDYYILNAQFEPVQINDTAHSYLWPSFNSNTSYPYLLAPHTDDFTMCDVIDITTLEVVHSLYGVDAYYENTYIALDEDTRVVGIYLKDGTLLATIKNLYGTFPPQGEEGRTFCFIDNETGDVVHMRDDGTEIARRHFEGNFLVSCEGNIIKIDYLAPNGVILYDKELNEIESKPYVAVESYSLMNDIIIAAYLDEDNSLTSDLLDVDGTVLLENVSVSWARDYTRLVAEQDGCIGIIDGTGTWLCKYNKATGEIVAPT